MGRLSERRLVTLTGSGGVGKTRTAIEIGWLSSDLFPGGVWLVELAPLGVGDAVPAAVAATLGVQLQPGSTMTESIVWWLRARPTLLILDNCEHVLDDVATLVTTIEAGAPTTTVLATSREPLGLPGEIVRRVPSLDPATDAVRLFAERAATAADGFVVDESNRSVIAAICARLDGIPLAIELAAARVRALSPSEILARLDDRFRLLRSSGRGGHERHHTLLAAVTWSVQLLSTEERCLFERLSVFAGSFSLTDVEAVCGFDPLDEADVVDLLSALVDRSMVVAEPGPDGATRYRLLETLRQYGEQAIATDPTATATMRDRHLAHFLARAEHWYAQQSSASGTRGQQGLRGELGQPPGRVRLGAGHRARARRGRPPARHLLVRVSRRSVGTSGVGGCGARHGRRHGEDRQRGRRSLGRVRAIRRRCRGACRPRSHRTRSRRTRCRTDLDGPHQHRVHNQRRRRA